MSAEWEMRCEEMQSQHAKQLAQMNSKLDALRSELQQELKPLLELWRDKLGDANARVREAAEAVLAMLCSQPEVGASSVVAHVVSPIPPKKKGDPKQWAQLSEVCHTN